MTDYTKLAAEIGALVTSKQQQYGDSVSKSGRILEILYPEGVQPHQYTDALLVVRILDKLSRIAQRGPDGQDKGGESPYRDIAGYGLLGASKDGAPVVEAETTSSSAHSIDKVVVRNGAGFDWDIAYFKFRSEGHSPLTASEMADEEIAKSLRDMINSAE